MKLGICGPIETAPLAAYLDTPGALPPGLGGTPVTALTRSALDRGWDVTVFSLCPTVTTPVVVRGPRFKMILGPYRQQGRARDLFRTERAFLAEAIRAERPEAVHAHWTYEFALGALDSGLPSVITAHDRPLRILRWDLSPYRAVRAFMAALVSRRAPLLTAVSEPVADHFARFFPCRARPIVIPNGLAGSWFNGEPAATVQGPPIFASVLTGWGPLKNAATLLEAFAIVRRHIAGSRLLVFGTGHGPGEAAELWASSQGLASDVDFRGHVSQAELRESLEIAHVFVHPSREESYSMAIAEAMAIGVPVIATRGAGTIADTLGGGRCAILTDGASPDAMARDMIRLASSQSLRLDLAARAREAATASLHMDRVFGDYADAYRMVARTA